MANELGQDMPLYLEIELAVIDELGINLYSNTAAILSELVANAWDADAKNVSITISPSAEEISISDDGIGMDRNELQEKFLTVGYRKRGPEGRDDTSPGGRKYMGRKGIGKLSIFGIASEATVETVKLDKDGENTYRGGVTMDLDDIKDHAQQRKRYSPAEFGSEMVSVPKGTTIRLRRINRRLHQTEAALRRRIARRFSILGKDEGFTVTINGKTVTPADRDYFHRLQYVTWIGDDLKRLYSDSCRNMITGGDATIPDLKIATTPKHTANGWLGFVKNAEQMKDEDGESLNRIILVIRGKLAHEDLLPYISENRVGRNYLMGEIHADFLDTAEGPDIATASRQSVKETDERFKLLIQAVTKTVKDAVADWDKKRKKKSGNELLEIEAIKKWLLSVDDGDQKHAKKLISAIGGAADADAATRETLVKHTIVAFEHLRYENRLHELSSVDENNVESFLALFGDISRLEASMYSEIVKGRIKAIERLQKLVKKDALEKLIQELLAENLWLLDTSWERATDGDEVVEKSIKSAWGDLQEKAELEAGRVDIAYKVVSGEHLIIELKRAGRTISFADAYKQAKKYISAFKEARKLQGDNSPRYQVRIIVGREFSDWGTEADEAEQRDMLKRAHIEVAYYDQLTEAARASYREYIKRQKQVSDLQSILDGISIETAEHTAS